jgi:HNH endonuclease
MTQEFSPPGVAPEQEKVLAESAHHYHTYYDVMFTRVLPPGGKKETLGQRRSPCRFCGRSAPEVTFKKIAHAVPEFAGNGVLLTAYECDACNDRFSAFEDDLGKMTLLYRVAGQVIGKGGVPSVKTPQKLSRVNIEASGLKINHFEDDPIIDLDKEAKKLTLTVKSQPFRPLGAYKALVKMALSVMEESDLVQVAEALRWLKASDLETDRIDDGLGYICQRTFTPGPAPYPGLVLLLQRRRPGWQDGPCYVFVIAFGNLSFQIVVPSPSLDAGLHGRQLTLHPVPLYPFMVAEKVKGATQHWQEHFDSPAPTKGEQSITFSFDRMEELTPQEETEEAPPSVEF